MNTKTLLSAALIIALASCSGLSDKTRISGEIDIPGVSEVNIVIPAAEFDTLVPVVEGRFEAELPVCITDMAVARAGQYKANFISDGSALSIKFGERAEVESSSRHIQHRFNEYLKYEEKLSEELNSKIDALRADATLAVEQQTAKADSVYRVIISQYIERSREVLAENIDNILSLIALDNVKTEMEADEILKTLDTLSEKIQENDYVKGLRAVLDSKGKTAEGQMFTDFTIEDSNGKSVKFSDYVGKGKYVLVDFWASWCGPCKREIPVIKAVYDKYKGKDFDVLSIAVWDKPEDTVKSAREHGVVWSQIINAQAVPTSIYGIESIPHIMLIGPDGTILKRNLRGAAIEKEVAGYLSE